jgi:hypothetical protein
MSTGNEQLQSIIERVKAIGNLAEIAAPDVARAVEIDLRLSIADGTTPYGEKWKLTQEHQQPLQNAMKALHVAAVGGTIYVRLTGPEARHHRGAVRGGVRRQVIPSNGKIPDRMAARIRKVLEEHFEEASYG